AVRVHELALLGLVALDREGAVPFVPFEQADARERDIDDAWLRSKPFDDRLVERGHARRRIAADVWVQVERDEALRFETEVEQPQIPETSNGQTGTHEKEHRDRHLRDDEPFAHADAAGTANNGSHLILERRR